MQKLTNKSAKFIVLIIIIMWLLSLKSMYFLPIDTILVPYSIIHTYTYNIIHMYIM